MLRVSLDKARNGYKGFKAQKAFRLPGGKCLADAPPKAFKYYLPFVLVDFCPFRPFRLFGPFAVFAAIAYFEMNNYLCKIEYYGRSTVVYFNVYK